MTNSNIDLKPHTTIKISTIASQFITVKSREEFIKAIREGLLKSQRVIIIGGGSNTIFASDTFEGLIVKNMYFSFEIINENDLTADIRVSSGMPVSMLINKTIDAGLEGFEYHQGLPGSVGGALYMNSKWTKPTTYFGDNLIEATLLDREGKEKKVTRDYFNFAYDFSELQNTHEFLIDATFRLNKLDPTILRERATRALQYRKETQPFGVASSGCMFQNINGQSAGELIDKAGLKGKQIGGFRVSDIHANFIINDGNGTVQDLKKLLSEIKKTVKDKFNVELVEEVRVIS